MSARTVNHQFQPPNLQKEDAGQSISEDVIIKLEERLPKRTQKIDHFKDISTSGV